MTDAETTAAVLGWVGICLLVLVPLSLLPTIIAFRRRHPDRWLITATNLILGATGVGWIAALTWALRFDTTHGDGMEMPMTADGVSRLGIGPWDASSTRDEGHPAERERSLAAAIAEIERLSDLRAAGHLSEAEFAELKARALGAK